MKELHFTQPGTPVNEYSIAVNNPPGCFFKPPTNETHQIKVATYARNQSGTIVAGILGKFSTDHFLIQGLWVNDSFREQGVATKLLVLLEQHILEKKITTIKLETSQLQLFAFYIKRGYSTLQFENVKNKGRSYYMLQKSLTVLAESKKNSG